MMKCDSYPKCHGEELVYHCVRFKTNLVEVCAPNLRIVCVYESGTYIIMELCVTIKKRLQTFSNVENCKKISSNFMYVTCTQAKRTHKYFYLKFYLDINLNLTFFTYQSMYK